MSVPAAFAAASTEVSDCQLVGSHGDGGGCSAGEVGGEKGGVAVGGAKALAWAACIIIECAAHDWTPHDWGRSMVR